MPSARFPKSARLLTPRDFRRVLGASVVRKAGDERLGCVAADRDDPDAGARLGFALTKKRVRSAVARNRIKRVARDSFRHHFDELPSLDIVILARGRCADASRTELHATLARLWTQLRSAPTGPSRPGSGRRPSRRHRNRSGHEPRAPREQPTEGRDSSAPGERPPTP